MTIAPDATGQGRDVATDGFDLAAAYDAHAHVLLGFAVNALRDRPLAEDCVQETFLRAWRARATFDPERASLRTWLFVIARRVVIDAARTRQRAPVGSTDALDDVPADAADPLARMALVEALARLSDEQRIAVVAVHLRGLDHAAAAAEAGVPVATMRTRVFYGLRALRSHLDGMEPTP